MGLINFIQSKIESTRQMKEAVRSFKNAMEEREAAIEKYITMSTEEFTSLPEEILFEAALARTENKVDGHEDMIEGINALNEAQKILYSINYLDIEVQNGGLCQFFVNSSRAVAPLISEYLEVIGANDHKLLYDDFVTQNQIDLTDLSSFEIDDISEYEAQTERYSFDDFDDAYYNLVPLEDFLAVYVKQHLMEF